MANKTRPIKLTLRVNENEHEIIKKKAKYLGLNMQELLLQSAIYGKAEAKTVPSELIEIIKELKAQGNNLNQLIKKLNATGYIDYKQTLPIMAKELRMLWQSLRQYLQKDNHH